MKSKFCFYFLLIIFSQIGLLKGQDMIILKTGDSLKVVVIQMDYGNTYYKDYDKLNESVKSLRNDLIKEIVFKKYEKLHNDDIYKVNHDKNITKNQRGNGYKIKETGIGKKFGIGGNILPVLDISADYDVSDNVNLNVGLGIGYILFGGRYYPKSSKVLNRFFVGGTLFVSLITRLKKVGLHLPLGIELRSKSGLYLRFELGPLFSSESFFVLPRMGAGLRF